MKTSFFLAALMLASPAFARVGETTDQLNKRYGKPLEIIRETLETRRYSFRGFTILVGVDQGISQGEIFRKEDNSRMTEAEIHGLLQANAGPSPWRSEPDENLENIVYWSKDKKTRVAIYTLKTHTLLVTSKASLARLVQLANTSDQKKMPGF